MTENEQHDESRDEREEPVVRDKRRIDPDTGAVRDPEASADASDGSAESAGDAEIPGGSPEPVQGTSDEFIEAEGPDVETSFTDADLSFLSGQTSADELAAERLVDLQRVTAEYANYRKRTEANRDVERERTVGDVVKVLLPVLDDLDRAEKHGDLAEGGPFTAIAQKLRAGTEKLGLTKVGAAGDPFDPTVHEAIFQQPVAGTEVETVADVVESGYYLGSTLLRAAKVVVAVPA